MLNITKDDTQIRTFKDERIMEAFKEPPYLLKIISLWLTDGQTDRMTDSQTDTGKAGYLDDPVMAGAGRENWIIFLSS